MVRSSLIIGLRCRPGLRSSGSRSRCPSAGPGPSCDFKLYQHRPHHPEYGNKHAEGRAPLAGLLGWYAERDSERLASMTSAVRFASIRESRSSEILSGKARRESVPLVAFGDAEWGRDSQTCRLPRPGLGLECLQSLQRSR